MSRAIGLLWLLCALALPVHAQTVEYIHTDALGSPVAVTDANRNVIERSEYEPFGALLNRPPTDGPGYTGHVLDAATSMNYMQQRYYDPAIGRFLSVDPVTADANLGTNFNRYWYANNNPYRFTDPDGRWSCEGGSTACKSPGLANSAAGAMTAASEGGDSATPWKGGGGSAGRVSGASGSWATGGGGGSWGPRADGPAADQEGLEPVCPECYVLPLLRGVRGVAVAGETASIMEGQAALRAGQFTFARGAAKHAADLVGKGPFKGELARPFYNSPNLINQIIANGRSMPDVAPGALRYLAPGSFRGTAGTWELVLHVESKTIYHFNFVGL